MSRPGKERYTLEQVMGLCGNKVAKKVLLEERDWTIAIEMHKFILSGRSAKYAAIELMNKYKNDPASLGPQEARKLIKGRGLEPGVTNEPSVPGVPESQEAYTKIYRKMKKKYPIYFSQLEINDNLITSSSRK